MSRLSIAVAVALASGCGPGAETGKDGEDALGGFGQPVECVDGYATVDREDGIPLAVACEEGIGTGDGTVYACAPATVAVYPDRVAVACSDTVQVYLRWL